MLMSFLMWFLYLGDSSESGDQQDQTTVEVSNEILNQGEPRGVW